MDTTIVYQQVVSPQDAEWHYAMQRFWATGVCPLCDGTHGNNAMCQAGSANHE